MKVKALVDYRDSITRNNVYEVIAGPDKLGDVKVIGNAGDGIALIEDEYEIIMQKPTEKPMKAQQFKAYKMKIENPEHSKVVQEVLFKLGYRWFFEDDGGVKHTEMPYLFTDGEGDSEILCSSCGVTFEEDTAQELDVSWMNPVSRETVEVNGKVYYKDEVESVLKGLEIG